MKFPRLITRRRAKWIGMSFTVATAVLYVLSTFVSIGYQHHDEEPMLNHEVQLSAGRLKIRRYDPSRASATWYHETYWWVRWSGTPRLNIVPHVEWNKWTRTVHVPLWLPLLFFALPTARLWYTDRRAKPWQCPKCRYDLRGVGGVRRESGEVDSENRRTGRNGVCPECGRVIDHSNKGEPSAD
ncbi:MAG: hypothetical protein IID31_11425 [Planctomycetes bacterium]|nr:hypothetical protein [Planctomycetota bacterium]